MKTLLPAILFLAASASMASAAVLAQWTFETSIPTTAGPLTPEVGSGTGTAFHADAATGFSNPVGNGSPESWSADRWTVGDYWQFEVSTVGYENITLSWDQTSSNTGPRDFGLYYSTDGTTFTQFGSDYTVLANASPNPAWSSGTYQPAHFFPRDLSAVTALDQDASVFFRIVDESTVSANGGTVGTAGTSRIDSFTVMADELRAVPEGAPGLGALAGALGLIAVLRRHWKRQ
jgi:hypothetical protein